MDDYAERASNWLARALEAKTLDEQNTYLELAMRYHRLISTVGGKPEALAGHFGPSTSGLV